MLDVPPGLGARGRLLADGDTNKNDTDDARPAAIAALRSASCREVTADDHAAVPKVRAERHRDLGRTRTQVACRLHAVLRAGPRRRPQEADRRPGRTDPGGDHASGGRGARPRARAGRDRDLRCRPGLAGVIIGDVRDVSRFPDRDHFAACNGTAPIEVSSGPRKTCRLSRRGNRRINHAIHMAAVTQVRHRHSKGRACHDKKLAEG